MPQNLIPNEPSLKDLLDLMKKDLLLNLNCHHLATIQSFNPLTQTATATINYKKTYYMPNVAGVYQPILKDYPVLIDCPVFCLGGGNGALTFPISTGDECLVLFNDRDMDNWFNGSSNSAVATPRLHSFSDGLILVGVRSLANVLVDYDTDGPTFRNKLGTTKIKLTDDKISGEVGPGMTFEFSADGKFKINNLTSEFVAAVFQLFTDIQGATTNTIFGPQPLIMPTFTADLAALETFKE